MALYSFVKIAAGSFLHPFLFFNFYADAELELLWDGKLQEMSNMAMRYFSSSYRLFTWEEIERKEKKKKEVGKKIIFMCV